MKRVLILSTISGILGRDCVAGIFKAVSGRLDWSIRLLETPEEILSLMRKTPKPDGLIIALDWRDDLLPEILVYDIPTVMVYDKNNSSPSGHRRFALIKNDDIAVGRCGARYLFEHGRFASYVFIPSETRTSWSVFRERGFRLELGKHGIVPHTWNHGNGPLPKFLKKLPPPIAVLGANDTDATSVIEACRAVKLRIPNQVAIVGVDDDEMLCESTRPQLSSVKIDGFGTGELAARTLERLMSGAKRTEKLLLIKPSGVTERASSRSIPPAGHLIHEAQRFIRDNIDTGVAVSDVAQHLKVSPSLIRMRFSEILGTSVRETILETRLACVKRRLRQSRQPLAQVAKSCGFASLSHLSHFFREKTGYTPSQFRKINGAIRR